jgi:hypothetical protein
MVDSLVSLSAQLSDEPCCLILDLYRGHRTEAAKAKAVQLGIEPLFVSAGGMSKYQPLDRRVFEELKARARAESQGLDRVNGPAGSPYEIAIKTLKAYCDRIPEDNIRKAWNVE